MADSNDPYDDLKSWATQADPNGNSASSTAVDDPYTLLKASLGSANTTSNATSKPSNKTPSFSDAWDSYDAVKQQFGDELMGGMQYGPKDVALSVARPLAWFADQAGGGGPNNRIFRDAVEQQIQQRNQEFNQGAGKTGVGQAGRVVGDIATSAPLMAAGGELAGAAAEGVGVPATVTDFLGGSSNGLLSYLPSRAAQGAIQGAEVTGLTNASTNVDPGKQLTNNVELGAMLNPALAVGGKLAGYIGSKFGDAMASPTDFANNKLMQALQRDGYQSADDVNAALEKLGPDASLADLGPNTMRLARAAHTSLGGGTGQIENFLENRQGDAGDRIKNVFYKNISGQEGEPVYGVDDLVTQQKQAAKPFYEQAFAENPTVQSDKIKSILSTPAGKQALAKGQEIMANDMAPSGEITQFNPPTEPGENPTAVVSPSLRTLHYTKMALDDKYQTLVAAGKNAEAAPIAGLRQNLNDELVKASGGADGPYAQGNSVWAEYAPKVQAAKNIESAINNAGDGNDLYKRVFGSKSKRDALADAMPDDDSYNAFHDAMQAEKQFFKTNKAITGQSATVNKGIESADAAAPIDMEDAAHLASQNYGGFALRKMGQFLQNGASMSPERSNAFGRLMTNQKAGLSAIQDSGLGTQSYLPAYVNMLAGAYGLPATEIGVNRAAAQNTQ